MYSLVQLNLPCGLKDLVVNYWADKDVIIDACNKSDLDFLQCIRDGGSEIILDQAFAIQQFHEACQRLDVKVMTFFKDLNVFDKDDMLDAPYSLLKKLPPKEALEYCHKWDLLNKGFVEHIFEESIKQFQFDIPTYIWSLGYMENEFIRTLFAEIPTFAMKKDIEKKLFLWTFGILTFDDLRTSNFLLNLTNYGDMQPLQDFWEKGAFTAQDLLQQNVIAHCGNDKKLEALKFFSNLEIVKNDDFKAQFQKCFLNAIRFNALSVMSFLWNSGYIDANFLLAKKQKVLERLFSVETFDFICSIGVFKEQDFIDARKQLVENACKNENSRFMQFLYQRGIRSEFSVQEACKEKNMTVLNFLISKEFEKKDFECLCFKCKRFVVSRKRNFQDIE